MSTNNNDDHSTFKDFEHTGWERAAEEYHRLWGKLSIQTVERMLSAVRIKKGNKVLDVATGAGYVAAAAKERGAEAIGLDFSCAQVVLARKEYPNVRFDDGDMENLPYENGHFDTVVMNFGLLHSLRPEKVIDEAFRVLKPGGRYAYTVWAKPEVSAGFRIVLGTIEKYGTMDVPLPPAQPYFRFSDKTESLKLVSKAGFKEPSFEIIPLVWRLASPEELFQAFYQGAVRATVILRNQSEDALARIRPEILTACEYFAIDEGIEVPMGAALTVVTKP